MNFSCEDMEVNTGNRNRETANRKQKAFPPLYCTGDATEGRASEIIQGPKKMERL